mmetsp:Transcript_46404/g.122532  ORF Transcript_46404/g.122532 Transcript_46404/m.122532 type:complete len:663 (+) Transcript_46404:145-2133(+)
MKCWVGGLAAHVAVARNLVGSKPTIDLDGWTEIFTDTKVDVAMWPLQPLQFLNTSAPGRTQILALLLLLVLAAVVICWLEYSVDDAEVKPSAAAARQQRKRSRSPVVKKTSSGYSQPAFSGDIGRPSQAQRTTEHEEDVRARLAREAAVDEETRKRYEHNSEVLRQVALPAAASTPVVTHVPVIDASPASRQNQEPIVTKAPNRDASPTFRDVPGSRIAHNPLPMEARARGGSPVARQDVSASTLDQSLQRSANTSPLMSGPSPVTGLSPVSSLPRDPVSPMSALPDAREAQRSKSPTAALPEIQRVSPREMEVERSKVYGAYPGSTQNVAAVAAAAYPGSVQDMRTMTLTDGLPLPKGSLAYEGQCSHPSFRDAGHPLRVEFWQDNGRWIGAWGTANRSERVEIDFPKADFISVWNPVGVRTELRGKAESDGVVKGEVFQDGEGGGSFFLQPVGGPMVLSREQRYPPAESSQQQLGVPLPSNASVPSTGGVTNTSARSAAAGVDQDASPLQFRTVPSMGPSGSSSPKLRPGTINLPTAATGMSAVRQTSGSRSPTVGASPQFRTVPSMGPSGSSSPKLRPGGITIPMRTGSTPAVRQPSGSQSPSVRSPVVRGPMVMSPPGGVRMPSQGMPPPQAGAPRVVQRQQSPQSMPPSISGFVVRR